MTSADPGGQQQPPGAYPPPAPQPQGPEAYPPGPQGPEPYPPPGPAGPEGYPSDPGYGAPQPPPGGYGQPEPGYGGEYPPGGYPPGPPGYPPGPGYFGPPPGDGGKKSGRGLLIGVLAILLVAAIGAASFLVINSGGGDDDNEVTLEPIDFVQEDDFADNLDVEDLGQGVAIALTETPAREPAVDATLAGSTLPGDEPGLYGGSQNAEVCNIEQLVSFLTDEANSDKAEAWAGALDIEVADIASYIDGLTPVRLRFDTRVTNHGFKNGQANPFQSVLQAGTAVLVDSTGVPRVKCNCGNPLAEPQPLGDAGVSEDEAADLESIAANPDQAWDTFDVANVVVINEGDEVETFVMMDFEDGRIFRRPIGTDGLSDAEFNDRGDLCDEGGKLAGSPTCGEPELGTGDVQVTLRWESRADLDLHIFEPDGTEIYWQSKNSASGGYLDVDANALCGDDAPVENVFWPPGGAPTGTYTVSVHGYALTDSSGADCGSGAFTLTIRVAGEEAQVYEGSVGDGESIDYTFEA